MPASATVQINDAGAGWVSPTNGVNISASDVVQIRLANTAGVVAWQLTCTGTDELSSQPVISVTGTGNTLRQFTAGAAGSSYVFASNVVDGQGNTSTTTFAIYVPTSGGSRVLAVSERFEGNSVYGWITDINPAIRAAGTFTLWTYHTVITSDTSLSRLLYQIQPVDTSGGTFTLTLPTSPSTGDRVDIEDAAAAATTGLGATALTIQGTGIYIQNPHNMTVPATTYALGPANGDAGGATLCLRYNGTFWKVIGN